MQLPILAITGRALAFVFLNLFTLFRLAWLPVVALVAMEWLTAYVVAWASPGAAFDKVSENELFAVASFTTLLLEGLALSVVAVSVHRVILFENRRPGHYFGFPFGKTEFLYVLMGALSIFFVLLLVSALSAGVFALAAAASGQPASDLLLKFATEGLDKAPPAAVGVLIVGGIIGYVALLWLSLRLSVWPPAVVANNRLALGEAWRLSKGQVFAMFGLLLLSSLIILIPTAAVARVVFGTTIDMNSALPFAPFDENVKFALAHPATLPDPNLLLFQFALNFLFVIYTIAVLSYAYKELKGYAHDLPIDGQDAPVGGAFQPMGAL